MQECINMTRDTSDGSSTEERKTGLEIIKERKEIC
jgi:hypothetical protein